MITLQFGGRRGTFGRDRATSVHGPWKIGYLVQTSPLSFKVHSIEVGDEVWIKTWRKETLKPDWEGPFLVLLVTDTAVRTSEKGWTHYTRVKKSTSTEWYTIPVPEWTGILDQGGFLGGIFSNWKQALFMGCMIFIGLMMLPCLIPLIRNIVQSSISSMMQSQSSVKSIMILKEIGDQIQLLESMEEVGPMKGTPTEKNRLIEIQKNIKLIVQKKMGD
uniref:Murine leukemia virus integrase C-terminal domain-containing protein n=1 Tax=Micrurus carvalhoi TaxID=3147026 RepID=A0A2H6N2P7_9SAUR